ncbi:MAG: hypothetical protein ACRCV0_06495 [Brevinema sp.]
MQIIDSMLGYVKSDTEIHRYYSWWLCYEKFQTKIGHQLSKDDYHELSLILGMYLASWGMGRNSKLQSEYNYLIHKPMLKEIMTDKLYRLIEDSKNDSFYQDTHSIERIKEIYDIVDNYYRDIKISTPTLISKIILGISGLMPAYDR